MVRALYISLPLLFSVVFAGAQVHPMPGSELNYNQVLLEHPSSRGASEYIVQLTYDIPGFSFAAPIAEQRDSFNATIISNLKFGKNYLWRYCSISKGKPSAWMGPYSFSILADPYLVNQNIRLQVLQNDSLNNSAGLISIDEFRSILDRHGNLVWFMPLVKTGFRNMAATEDLTLTRAGTITALGNENGFETDLLGGLLWVTPFKTKSKAMMPFGDYYNHELKRLPDNHYMVIGRDNEWKKLPAAYDITKIPYLGDSTNWRPVLLDDGIKAMEIANGYYLRKENDGFYLLLNMGAIVEYDKNNNVIWLWKANDYLMEDDIFPKGEPLHPGIKDQDPHLNGFSIDKKNEYIYASFRKLDRIVKIEKKTGKVVYSWGSKMSSGEARDGADFFHRQHAPAIMDDGNIALFNNGDMANANEPSGVVIFSSSRADKPAKIAWKYDCIFDSAMSKNKSSRGGNVDVLPNNNYLVCMGAVNRIFEITRDKKIVWNVLAERKAPADSAWQPLPLYRAHYSSSLYPCYFTVETDRDSIGVNDSGFTLKINNVGTEGDSYSISVTSPSCHYAQKLHSGLIAKKKRAEFKITPSSKPVPGEEVEIRVNSDNNTDFERKVFLICH